MGRREDTQPKCSSDRRRRVTALLNQAQYEQLERLAEHWDKPVSDVVVSLLTQVLRTFRGPGSFGVESGQPPEKDSTPHK
jgi:hypothetical protein